MDFNWSEIEGIKGLWICKNFLDKKSQTALMASVEKEGWFQNSTLNQAMRFFDLPSWAENLSDLIGLSVSEKNFSKSSFFSDRQLAPFLRANERAPAGHPDLRILWNRKPLFNQMIANSYEPGEGISSHVDLLRFEDGIAIVSLLSSCVMTFKKTEDLRFTEKHMSVKVSVNGNGTEVNSSFSCDCGAQGKDKKDEDESVNSIREKDKISYECGSLSCIQGKGRKDENLSFVKSEGDSSLEKDKDCGFLSHTGEDRNVFGGLKEEKVDGVVRSGEYLSHKNVFSQKSNLADGIEMSLFSNCYMEKEEVLEQEVLEQEVLEQEVFEDEGTNFRNCRDLGSNNGFCESNLSDPKTPKTIIECRESKNTENSYILSENIIDKSINFEEKRGEKREREMESLEVEIPVLLNPGDLLILCGEARYSWTHGIYRDKEHQIWEGCELIQKKRVSITLRKMVSE